jgi:hypothetical protein
MEAIPSGQRSFVTVKLAGRAGQGMPFGRNHRAGFPYPLRRVDKLIGWPRGSATASMSSVGALAPS